MSESVSVARHGSARLGKGYVTPHNFFQGFSEIPFTDPDIAIRLFQCNIDAIANNFLQILIIPGYHVNLHWNTVD